MERPELLLQALGDVPIVWVTHTASGSARDPANEQLINDVIRAAPATHPNVTVLDLAPTHPLEPIVLSPDGVHLLRGGARVVRRAHRRGRVGSVSKDERSQPRVAALTLAAAWCSPRARRRPPHDNRERAGVILHDLVDRDDLGDRPPLVAMLGDSNTYLSIPELESAFDDAGLPVDDPRDLGVGAERPRHVTGSRRRRRSRRAAGRRRDRAGDQRRARRRRRRRVRRAPRRAARRASVTSPVVWVTHTELGGQGRDPADERAVNDVIRAAPVALPERDGPRPRAGDRRRTADCSTPTRSTSRRRARSGSPTRSRDEIGCVAHLEIRSRETQVRHVRRFRA